MPRKISIGHPLNVFLLAGALSLSGCSSTKPPAPTKTAQVAKPRPVPAKRPTLPPAGSGRGGYYMDDGPGDTVPDDLESLNDAIPRLDPYSTRGNKPYVVFGKTYTPFTDDRPYKARGHGSWYGKKFHGNKTSSGELYDMYEMTAAHPTLPIPSYARVTHVASGRQVVVRVNDRGPFLAGRVIDLSYTAALKLGYLQQGSAELEVERLLPDEIVRLAKARNAGEAELSSDAIQLAQNEFASESNRPTSQIRQTSGPRLAQAPAGQQLAVFRPATTTPGSSSFYLQLGAFSEQTNAALVHSRLSQNWLADLPQPELAQTDNLYRIYTGPFASRDHAYAAAAQLQNSGMSQALIVQR